MKKNTETAKIPMINQVLKRCRAWTSGRMRASPESDLWRDCSSYERMEETLLEVKNCFLFFRKKEYRRHLRPILPAYTPDDEYKHLMEYKERITENVRQHGLPHRKQQVYCKPYCIIGDHVKLREFGKRTRSSLKKSGFRVEDPGNRRMRSC